MLDKTYTHYIYIYILVPYQVVYMDINEQGVVNSRSSAGHWQDVLEHRYNVWSPLMPRFFLVSGVLFVNDTVIVNREHIFPKKLYTRKHKNAIAPNHKAQRSECVRHQQQQVCLLLPGSPGTPRQHYLVTRNSSPPHSHTDLNLRHSLILCYQHSQSTYAPPATEY